MPLPFIASFSPLGAASMAGRIRDIIGARIRGGVKQKGNIMRKLALAAAAVAALGLSAPAADAKSGVKIGVLTCSVEGGVGLILVSSKKVNCVYQPSGGGRVERYEGRIRKLVQVIFRSDELYGKIVTGRGRHYNFVDANSSTLIAQGCRTGRPR